MRAFHQQQRPSATSAAKGPFFLRQPVEVPAEHYHPEVAGELIYRIERRDLVVQPCLDLLEPRGLQAPLVVSGSA